MLNDAGVPRLRPRTFAIDRSFSEHGIPGSCDEKNNSRPDMCILSRHECVGRIVVPEPAVLAEARLGGQCRKEGGGGGVHYRSMSRESNQVLEVKGSNGREG